MADGDVAVATELETNAPEVVSRTIPAMDLLDLLCDLIGATPFVALCVEAVNRGIARGVMHGDVPESVDSVGWCTEKGETIPGGDPLLRRRGTS